ncbi:hypothetical protein HK098_008068 [Nowakowskiella sp. JEL0407]|nr:hypothetical protein HK098_008068 [Nowakowskiella sp. JEL0407]
MDKDLHSGLYFIVPENTTTDQKHHNSLSRLPLKSTRCSVRIINFAAVVNIEHEFYNDFDFALECRYRFPLIDSAAVFSFEATIGGKTITGKVKESEEAKQDYQAAVKEGKVTSLLEQTMPDVFQAILGNFPPKSTATIRLSYVTEISQDVEDNQIRFMLPTVIAPRYGTAPFDYFPNQVEILESSKLYIDVVVEMSCGHFQSISSPSHTVIVKVNPDDNDPIEVAATELKEILASSGKDESDSPSGIFKLGVSLFDSCTYLEKDFVLVIQAANLDQPTCVLEPSIEPDPTTAPNSHAMMLTLTPQFSTTEIRTELIFIVDRSASMDGDRIVQCAKALTLFLKSIPVGCYFNIIGFGSKFKALWSKSVAYSQSTLKKGLNYANSLNANFGGTEILKPLEHAFKIRRRDMPSQILMLTDGEVWNVDEVIKLVQKNMENAPPSAFIRVFTLGIGRYVSHHLVNAVSRAGKGYSSFVTDDERMEKKVIRMLKSALFPPITDYQISWPSVEKNNELDGIEMGIPDVMQAPHYVPSVHSGSRFLACALFNGKLSAIPSELTISGKCGAEAVSLTVPVKVSKPGRIIHTFTARRIIRDFEERTSFLHDEKISQTTASEDLVKQFTVEIGKKYSLASKYTSFIAISEDAEIGDESAANPHSTSFYYYASRDLEKYDYLAMNSSAIHYKRRAKSLSLFRLPSFSVRDMIAPMVTVRKKETKPADEFEILISLQNFTGSFSLKALNLDGAVKNEILEKLKEKEQEITSFVSKTAFDEIWGTIVAISMFKSKFDDRKEEWELVVEKAMKYLHSKVSGNENEAEDFIKNWILVVERLISESLNSL